MKCENHKSNLSCDCEVIHEEFVRKARDVMIEEADVTSLAYFFKVFGDATRIKILQALSAGELCVCDIAALLNMTQSAISHQLKVLKNSKLVKFRREGKVVFYRLSDNHVKTIIAQGMEHLAE